MRKAATLVLIASGAALLGGCGSSGLLSRERPDEFAVSRQAPLVIPPDFGLAPPEPGAAATQGSSASQQALDALFGGPSPRSAVETDAISRAGTGEPAIRSEVGDPETRTVSKGAVTQDILAAPEGDGREAQAVIPS